MLQIVVQMGLSQQVDVTLELAFGEQEGAEALDRHVGKREETIEGDPVALAEHALVVGFQRLLRGRQARPLRIVDEGEYKPRLLMPVAQSVEPSQAANGAFEDAASPLPVDVLLEIAGH